MGPCSPFIRMVPRRAKATIERGRVKGFYLSHKIPAEVLGVLDAEIAEQERIMGLIQPYLDALEESKQRVSVMEEEFVDSIRPPRQFTDEDGVRWVFS